ncbi:MAG TPA: hypothetical protein VL947_05580, partial [Cytophagales bacterium]|nr:hypothetical protein [Cytophagales bacterium]
SYSGIISDELITKYVQGTASTAEVRHLEHLMLEDPFLADAIEGLKEGNWSQHEANIQKIKSYKDKSGLMRLSVTSVAAAAVVTLVVTYLCFSYFPGLYSTTQEVTVLSADTTAVDVHKEIKVITIKEGDAPSDASNAIAQEQSHISEPARDKKSGSQNGSTTNHLAFEQEKVTMKRSKPEVNPSKDKSSEARNFIVLSEGDTEEEHSASPQQVQESMQEARGMPKHRGKPAYFDQLALNTQQELYELETVEYKKKSQSIFAKKSSKKKSAYAKAKCDNCPDKAGVDEKNAVLDSIGANKAAYLYSVRAYEEAGRWYQRQPDVESKIMAGLSYLQASDTLACKGVESELSKVNTYASEYLKAIRYAYMGREMEALQGFQKLIDNNSPFKALAIKNKSTIVK